MNSLKLPENWLSADATAWEICRHCDLDGGRVVRASYSFTSESDEECDRELNEAVVQALVTLSIASGADFWRRNSVRFCAPSEIAEMLPVLVAYTLKRAGFLDDGLDDDAGVRLMLLTAVDLALVGMEILGAIEEGKCELPCHPAQMATVTERLRVQVEDVLRSTWIEVIDRG